MTALNYAADKRRQQISQANAADRYDDARRSGHDQRAREQGSLLAIAELYETRNSFCRSVVQQVIAGRPISPAQSRVLLRIAAEQTGTATAPEAAPKVTQLPTVGRPSRSSGRRKRRRKPIAATINFKPGPKAEIAAADSGTSPEVSGDSHAPAGTEAALTLFQPPPADGVQDAAIGVGSQVIASAVPHPNEIGLGEPQRWRFDSVEEREAFLDENCPAHRRLPL